MFEQWQVPRNVMATSLWGYDYQRCSEAYNQTSTLVQCVIPMSAAHEYICFGSFKLVSPTINRDQRAAGNWIESQG